ncbi:MAG: divalent-cation tolerance protein CutA, partial [Gemmatimonadota bacterium]
TTVISVQGARVTGPDRGKMIDLGRDVVEERLAACVNLIDGVRSVYRWDGRVQEDDEAMAVIKTTRGRLDELEDRVRELHPYDEPEFVALPVQEGSRSYLAWVADSVQPTTS